MDSDTVSAVNTHEKIFERFQKQRIPVLLGTQMVTKGLNFENVTLVGVLDGDTSLYAPSFRAAENTFDLIAQVVGRAGRGSIPGRAMIQTMSPEHRVLALAARQDYEGFYELELPLRRAKGCPPFQDLLLVTFSGREEDLVRQAAAVFRDALLSRLDSLGALPWELLGPAPAPVAKVNDCYRYRLTLRRSCDRALRQLVAFLLRALASDRRFRGLSAYADVNGYE